MRSMMAGLDLGSVNDYSALAVVERVRVLPPGMSLEHYHRREHLQGVISVVEEIRVRHLQRWALGTPYDVIVSDVAAVMASDQLAGAWLYFDATGVGVAVKDMLTQAFMAGRMGDNWPLPVTITGAGKGTTTTVPKRDLMSALQVALQQGRLKIAQGLALGDVLERELTSFRMKISAAGHDSYDVVRREGEGHGDLVIAVALAARRANHSVQPRLEESRAVHPPGVDRA